MVCDFCDESITAGVLVDGKYWATFLSMDQYLPGRSIVMLKRHAGSLSELTALEWAEFSAFVPDLEGALRKGLGAELCNWTCLMNDSYKKEHPDPHVHWHLRPRYRNPVEIAGETFVDKEFGHHYGRGTDRKVSDETRDAIAERIKRFL